MTTLAARRSTVVPLLAVAGAVVLAVSTQLAAVLPAADPLGLDEPLLDAPLAATEADDVADAPFEPGAELDGVRADITFWAGRLAAAPGDIVAAVKLAEADAAEARLTGDVTAYSRALVAADAALAAQPGYVPALASRGATLVALHRFGEARDVAREILQRDPGNGVGLGVLGDSSLELGDNRAAGSAYQALRLQVGGPASLVRDGRLAFVRGEPSAAVAADEAGVAAAVDEGLEGGALGFFHVTLGDARIATGDVGGARRAFQAALEARPDLPAALVGLARLDAFEGRSDDAIAELDEALAAIPAPDWLARRSDLLARRAGPGDAEAAAADRATIEAVASLAGEAGSVYDRGLVLYLSDHRLDPERAVRLARAELAVRPDVYGYDALAWALVNAADPAAADAPMQSALARGTRDARLWYHAGVIDAALGRTEDARLHLERALAFGPALDPAARERAQQTLDGLR
jgi:tetratricopeptide (TPR) repeat protein